MIREVLLAAALVVSNTAFASSWTIVLGTKVVLQTVTPGHYKIAQFTTKLGHHVVCEADLDADDPEMDLIICATDEITWTAPKQMAININNAVKMVLISRL